MKMTAAARSELDGDEERKPSTDPSLVREIAQRAELPERSGAEDLKGQIIGGRFEVRGTLINDELGLLLSALDRSVQGMVSLRMVRSAAVAREVSAQLSALGELSHPNLLPVFGVLRSGRVPRLTRSVQIRRARSSFRARSQDDRQATTQLNVDARAEL